MASVMSTTGELIRKMILAHTKGDGLAFKAAAEEVIAEERRKNHHLLARDLERLLANGSNTESRLPESLWLLGMKESDIPHDKERGAALVEIIEPQRPITDMALASPVFQGMERIINENKRADILRSFGLLPINKILFCGPPGCGKTIAAEAVAEALYLPLVLVRFDGIVSSYLGETASNLRKVFDFARSRPMIIFFDEFDAIGKRRTSDEEHGELKRVVNSFLQMLDGFRSEAVIIAATNHQGLLDPALWRRFDEIIFFDKPTSEEIAKVLERNLRQVGVSYDVNLNRMADSLIGMSHADVERIALDAVKKAVLDDYATIPEHMLAEMIERQRERIAVTEYPDISTTHEGRSYRKKR